MPKLSRILIYPIKSISGISVENWPLDHKGLRFDREWMLVDPELNFLSQRQLPAMALIKTQISEQQLIVSAPQQADLHLPLTISGHEPRLSVTVWHDRCEAIAISDHADAWFSNVLQRPCRLVRHAPDDIRRVDPDYALPQDQTAFSDGFPLLLLGEQSLTALSQAVGQDLNMLRFRPNLVVDDCAAYAEDYWRRIQIGDIQLRLPKPCSRCSVPAIDPLNAQIGKEPLTTLNRMRRANGKVYFGQNALHDQTGRLQVGDTLTVLESGIQQPDLSRI
jgi:uncharacterized protein